MVLIVTNRQRRILEMLLNRREVTAGEIAAEVQISTRTVHREMLEIEPVLSRFDLSLQKKSGIGISLHGEEEDKARLQKTMRHMETATYSSDERKVLILCKLLEETEPIKLFALAYELNAAIPTVSRDLDEIEPQLRKFGLELIRRRGYGVEISGDEPAKRRLIGLLARQYLDESDLFGASSEQAESWPVTRQLLHMVDTYNFFKIEQLLWKMEEGANRLSEASYTRLLIQLAVAVTRMQRGHRIRLPSAQTASAGGENLIFDARLERLMQAFDLDWTQAEKEYAQALLDRVVKDTPDEQAVLFDLYGIPLAESVAELIRQVEELAGIPFARDRSLLDGLLRHAGPALQRLREGETVRNPLLPQIRKDYDLLFAAVRKAADAVWSDISIPDEEIGYLVMHFGASVERYKLFPNHIRALVVCTSGIGSSKLLSVRIHKEIPQIEIVGHFSWYEASRMPKDRYDLIISTVDLPVEPARYIKISPLLTEEESEKLRASVRNIAADKQRSSARADNPDDGGSWERLKLAHTYISEAVQVLDRFEVHQVDTPDRRPNLRAVLEAILELAMPDGHAREKQAIAEQLIQRENNGSQVITGTRLALFHTRSELMEKPLLSLFRLSAPLMLGKEGADEVRHILLMLAPQTLGRPGLEVLSEISAMLLLPDMIRLLEEENKDAIKLFVSQELEHFVKIKWIGESQDDAV